MKTPNANNAPKGGCRNRLEGLKPRAAAGASRGCGCGCGAWRGARGAQRAFTLMEVMIASFIFALVLASLHTSFRVGVKAYDLGSTRSEGEQAARYTIDQVTNDLRNVYFKPSSTYNVTRRQREALQAERERQALQSGSRYDPVEDENMPELGPSIDLGFYAQDGDDKDEVSFVRLQTLKRVEDRKMWGLARIRYFVSGQSLYRSIDDVTMAEVDENGYELPKPVAPQVDKIANNVKSFDVKFGYYYDGEWLKAPDWDSNAARYRNPADEEEEEDDFMAPPAAGNAPTPQQPQQQQQKKEDDLPAWAEITFVFTDPKKVEKERTYTQVVQIVSSQETYLPPDAQDPNARSRDAFQGRRGRR